MMKGRPTLPTVQCLSDKEKRKICVIIAFLDSLVFILHHQRHSHFLDSTLSRENVQYELYTTSSSHTAEQSTAHTRVKWVLRLLFVFLLLLIYVCSKLYFGVCCSRSVRVVDQLFKQWRQPKLQRFLQWQSRTNSSLPPPPSSSSSSHWGGSSSVYVSSRPPKLSSTLFSLLSSSSCSTKFVGQQLSTFAITVYTASSLMCRHEEEKKCCFDRRQTDAPFCRFFWWKLFFFAIEITVQFSLSGHIPVSVLCQTTDGSIIYCTMKVKHTHISNIYFGRFLSIINKNRPMTSKEFIVPWLFDTLLVKEKSIRSISASIHLALRLLKTQKRKNNNNNAKQLTRR